MNSGFSIVPQVFSVAEVERVLDALDGVRRSRAGARHLLSVPQINALARDRRLIELAAEELGCDPMPFAATLFEKSAKSNWLVVWHQDKALPLLEKRGVKGWGPWSMKGGVTYAHAPPEALAKVVALRLHLDDSTLENGPLRVLPGTHTLGLLSDAQIHDLVKRIQPVACPVARGGVVAMRPLVVHASSKSVRAVPRRVLHLEYSASEIFADGLQLRAHEPHAADAIWIKCNFRCVGSARLMRTVRRLQSAARHGGT